MRGQGQAGPKIAATIATGQAHQLGSEAVATGQAVRFPAHTCASDDPGALPGNPPRLHR